MNSKVVPFFGSNAETGWLSNWYKSLFTLYGRELPIDYPNKDKLLAFCSVEQYMMFCKACCFKDWKSADKIMNCESQREIKAMGRAVKNYDDAVWSKIRYNVVKQGIELKVVQNENLMQLLMSYPVDTIFVEASPYDRIWGVGMPVCPEVYNPSNWRGKNLLGKAWQEVRKELG